MATLNEIADSILIDLGKPFDHNLREALKFTIKTYRARLLRQEFDKAIDLGLDSQHITIKLQLVDKADTCVTNVGCNVLRSVNKVPRPLKLKNDELFEYVGAVDGSNSYIRTRLAELPYALKLKYNGSLKRYDWINEYLYVFNVKLNRQRNLRISAIFADPSKAKDDCSEVSCYSDDDMEFPLADHLVQVLIEMVLSGKQPIINEESQEVNVQDDIVQVPATQRRRR